MIKVISNAVIHHPNHYFYLAVIQFEQGLCSTLTEEKQSNFNSAIAQLECAMGTLSTNDLLWKKKIEIQSAWAQYELAACTTGEASGNQPQANLLQPIQPDWTDLSSTWPHCQLPS